MAYDIVIGRGKKDLEKYGTKGTIFLGKHYVKMGNTTSLSNKVFLDMISSHVVFVVGKRGGGKCLTGDTLITLANGERIPIKELEHKNESVLTYDGVKLTTKKIENFYSRQATSLLKINLRSGKTLELTPEHPLLTKNSWQEAKTLHIGATIATLHEPTKLIDSRILWDEIVAIEKIEGDFTVYDLTVPQTHNFVANDIIVHNSYSLGVLAEGMADLEPEIRNNLSIILLDTMGIYWTMKYPNMPDKNLLLDWDLKPHNLDVTIFTPKGFYNEQKEKGIPTDKAFSIKPTELQGSDWTTTFDIDTNDALGVLIERTIHKLQEQDFNYSIQDIIDAIMKDVDADKDTKNAAKNHFQAADGWGVFDQDGTPLSELAAPGQITILDVSCYATAEHGWAVKSLVVGLTAEKLFNQRMLARKDEEFREVERQTSYFTDKKITQDYPMVWMVIDEAHEFLPKEGKTLASDPLITILREGRQPGISLVLASQQPGKIHTDVMTQSDTILAHRITAKIDTDALGTLMQSYMRSGLDLELDNLPRTKGAALILDDNNERMFPIQIRPRFTWHGGSSPSAIKEKKDLFG